MEMPATELPYPTDLQVPVDLFVMRKQLGLLRRGDFCFSDSSGNLVFEVLGHSSSSALPRDKRLLLDSSGNIIFSLYHDGVNNGSWQGFREDGHGHRDLIFRAERRLNTLTKAEFEVFHPSGHLGGPFVDLKVKGSPFDRSCTIYGGYSIVAQSSLMYKLGIGKVFVGRCRFRVTIFPGLVDPALVAALIVIFFDRS